MRFVKAAAVQWLLWVIMAIGLIGCASQPSAPPTHPDDAEIVAGQVAEPAPVPALLPSGSITQNPYLTAPAPAISAQTQTQFKRARKQMDQQQWGEARHTLQTLVAQSPNLSGPWLNLGIVWLHLEAPGQARAAFERALAANALNVDAYNQLAALERRAGDFAKADALYADALSVWPHSADTHCNRGILYDLYMGRWPDALAHYQACRYLREQQTGAVDNTVNGWVIDLERRIAAREANK
ncbi:tetratricopeptide repeat protein [Gilvimarinus polysaccharolyticus]|uniref:tetratricopeptide repeat protein n=1 Tax=Gilvimarinus polysaccharolyticus TaxID=863921 RepID=UPI0006736534|nr:tetratricopeptide repeat protein [Gilvimarinus polysaccharolyticus]